MILGNNAYLPEEEDVNPFLTNTAFAAEAAGGIMGWRLGNQAKNSRKQFRSFNTAKRNLHQDYFQGGSRQGNFKASSQRWSIPGQKAKLKTLAAEANNKRFIARAGATKYRALTKLLGMGTAVAIGMELGSGLFNLGSSYHSAERTRRMAAAANANESMYYDTRVASTMRQRALQVIHNSQLSTRAAFGQEASYLHV